MEIEQYDESSQKFYTLTDDGLVQGAKLKPLSELIDGEKGAEFQLAPTADGMVPLNHNHPEYAEIKTALDDAIKLAEETRPNDISGDQHASVIANLKSARQLWDSCELQAIQIRVGILMAIEAAQNQLKITFEAARGSLLIEAIKSFFSEISL